MGSPSYFTSYPRPRTPRDLTAHRCLNFRHGSAGLYHWEFDRGRKSLSVAVSGPLAVDDVDVMTVAALDGVGLAFTLEDQVAAHLASGALIRVLEDWCQPFAGYYLYHTSRRQQSPALTALIRTLRV